MSLIECIKSNLDIALTNYETKVSIKKVTYNLYELVYLFSDMKISIHFFVELMENDFSFEIKVIKENDKQYSVSDRKSHIESYYFDNNICFLTIFNFSKVSENVFMAASYKLAKKRKRLFIWKKITNKRAQLYASLVSSSLDNIISWASE